MEIINGVSRRGECSPSRAAALNGPLVYLRDFARVGKPDNQRARRDLFNRDAAQSTSAGQQQQQPHPSSPAQFKHSSWQATVTLADGKSLAGKPDRRISVLQSFEPTPSPDTSNPHRPSRQVSLRLWPHVLEKSGHSLHGHDGICLYVSTNPRRSSLNSANGGRKQRQCQTARLDCWCQRTE
ncbi:hypothetical protein RRG08_051950 [Elysia crispata]|uniref:Uncharacterized protein n=1 Tax=Elysia crispata TaxID=231223 RepID=A0AAE0Y263_9GAST|nr:hypothetical protein RRG08_051950 [Elysia crispata]